MDDVRITCVSDWLPIEYEAGEPFVLYNGKKVWIRDYVRFEDKSAHRTIDFDEYTKDDRFPRFVELWVDGTKVRLWSVVKDDNGDDFLKSTLKSVEVQPHVVEVLESVGIVTVGDLATTATDRLREIVNGNVELFNSIMSVKGNIESIIGR